MPRSNKLVDAGSTIQPSKADVERERKWRAESDLRSLREAEAIAKDRARLSAAKKLASEEAAALSSIAGRAPRRRK